MHLALGAPGDTEACGVEHGKVVGAVADGNGLGDGDVVLCGEGMEKRTLLLSVDNRECWDEFAS